MLTGVDLLTDKQAARLEALFADEQHSEVEATWGIYQRLVVAYRQPDKKFGRHLLNKVIDDISTGVPTALVEIRSLGRTLNRRAADVLAFFDRPGTSNSPHRGHQRPTRTPPRYRPGLPEPDPLHRPQPPRGRRIQTPTTPTIMKSR
nr:hypothetical protein GCM10023233_08060 [Brevibacterium otitidis]